MKIQIVKIGLLIIAIIAMISMNACSCINDDIAGEACKELEKKYSEEFQVLQIGDRLDTGHTKLYVCPVNNEEIVFTVLVNSDTGEIKDDYIIEKVNYQVKCELEAGFKCENIDAYVKCKVVDNEEIVVKKNDYTPRELYDDNNFEEYYIVVILDGTSCNGTKLLKAVQDAQKKIDVDLLVSVYAFDNTRYRECLAKYKEKSNMTETSIKKFEPYVEIVLKMYDGECNLSEEELEEMLMK